jgi:hypothetical protein
VPVTVQPDRSCSEQQWRFRIWLLVIVLVGLVVRLIFALSMMSRGLPGDAAFFHKTAANIASGKGYVVTSLASSGKEVAMATAAHGPVFPLVLAMFDHFGLQSIDAQRIALSIVVSSGVLVMGILGRATAGPAVGLVAAGVAAVNPFWFQSSGILMSESIYLVAIPLLLLISLECLDQPSVWRFLALGIAIAIAVLIRSEAIDFVVLLSAPVLYLATVSWSRRAVYTVALVGGLLLVLGPWMIRNEVQLGGPALSTNGGVTLAGSYCPGTFNPQASEYGSFDVYCSLGEAGILERYKKPPDHRTTWSELAINNALTTMSEHFARAHLGEMPGVVMAREEGVWGFGNQQYQLSLASSEGRNRTVEQLGQIGYWILLPFVVLGGITMAKRSRRRFVIIAIPLVVVALNAALFYGSTRMGTAAEPSLTIFAAIGLIVITTRLRRAFLDRRTLSKQSGRTRSLASVSGSDIN